MPSVKRYLTKDGRPYYLIRVRRGRDKSALSRRWYPPDLWSQKAIDRELAKVAAEFEREVQAGEVVSRAEKRQQAAQEAAEAAKILTLRQYSERVFMPSKTLTATENTRASFQGNLDKWILPALGDMKLTDITAAQISALLLDMQAKGKKTATVTKVYTILKSLFKMAYLSDMVSRNPMDKVQRPASQKAEQEQEAYTAAEVKAIMEALEGEPLKWRVFVRLLIETGVRRGRPWASSGRTLTFRMRPYLFAETCVILQTKGYIWTHRKTERAEPFTWGTIYWACCDSSRAHRFPALSLFLLRTIAWSRCTPPAPRITFASSQKRTALRISIPINSATLSPALP